MTTHRNQHTDAGPLRTPEEVGLIFGISGERVRQIEERALRKLRRHQAMLELAREYGLVKEETE